VIIEERWRVLTVLFLARSVMAFQFASVGAIAPLFMEKFQVDAAAVGLLIGLYSSPGLLFSLPGGMIARFFGDKRVVLCGIALMAIGGTIMAVFEFWGMQLTGRLIAGIGGILLNVVMTKMVTDWFSGREISTAMAVFVNSWPAGIALALVLQPVVAGYLGLGGTQGLTALLSLIGFALVLRYRTPEGLVDQLSAVGVTGAFPKGVALAAIGLAASIWGFFNAAIAMIFSFGPTILVERGLPLAAASASVSLVLWILIASGILGGFIADRSGRPLMMITIGAVLLALSMILFSRTDAIILICVMMGLLVGLPVGPIMSLPSRALSPTNRSAGMGIFFTIYAFWFATSPWMAGELIRVTGSTNAAMNFGVIALVGILPCLWLFERLLGNARGTGPARR
jgi:MFS family permease